MIRRIWRYAWQRARQAQGCGDDSVLVRTLRDSDMGRHALEALRQRELADEEAERNEPHPCLVGLVEQGKTSLAIRALQRRGWTMDTIKTTTLDLVNMAARLIRARAPHAGEVREYVCGFGGGGRRAVVQRSALVRLNGQLVPAVFFARHSAEGRQVIDAVTINVWRQRTKPARECYPAIRCEAAQQSGIACPPDSCDREDGLR